MEKLFDLDELHKGYRRKKIRNVSVVSLVLIAAIIGLTGLTPHNHNSNATVNLTGSTTPIGNNADAAQSPSTSTQQPTTFSGSTMAPPTTIDYTPNYTYTAPSTPGITQNNTNIAAPDQGKCPAIKVQMSAATASLEAQAAQLRSQIQTEQNYISNNSSYNWQSGYGQATPPDTSTQQAQLQRDQQQLNSIVSQISSIDASYAGQLTGNMCS